MGALETKDPARVTVDTTVQPEDITFPTDAKLRHAAIKGVTYGATLGVRLADAMVRFCERRLDRRTPLFKNVQHLVGQALPAKLKRIRGQMHTII